MKAEMINWHVLPDDGLPDADIVVLAEIRQPNGGTKVWLAWWSGERWVDAGSGWHVETASVVAWADVPRGVAA